MVLEGRIEAATQVIAARQLRDRGLVPVSINGSERGAAAIAPSLTNAFAPSARRRNKGPVTQADVMTLTSEMAIMLRAGLTHDGEGCIRIMAKPIDETL